MATRSVSGAGLLLALLAAALWGLTPIALKGTLAGYSPELVSVVRLVIATAAFRRLGGRKTRWLSAEPWTVLAGVALGADFLIYNYGIRHTTAGLAALVVNIEVVATVLLARGILGEQLTARRVLGAAVTMAGVVVVAAEGAVLGDVFAGEHARGNAIVMLAGVTWSVFAVAQRRAPRAQNLFQLSAPIFGVAALTTAPMLLTPAAWQNPGGGHATLMFAVLIALCTIAVYAIYGRSQELVDVGVLAIVLASIPVFAVALAWVLLGEAITLRTLWGGAVILAGVLVIATER